MKSRVRSVIPLFEVFARLHRAGRREVLARRYDRAGDRMAKKKTEANQLLQLAIKFGASKYLIAELETEHAEYAKAERNARILAKSVREGR